MEKDRLKGWHRKPMTLYGQIDDLEVEIEEFQTRRKQKEVSKEFTRRTTVVEVSGKGFTGRGEDIIYDSEMHSYPELDIAGVYSFEGFSRSLELEDLFTEEMQPEPIQQNYRRWAVESAVLDLALKQNGENLGSVLDREYSPVRFVVSPGLDGKEMDKLHEFIDKNPGIEFKLDVSGEWDREFVEKLHELDRVRIVDFKAHYEKDIGQPPADPGLYGTVVSGLPDVILEDPLIDDRTRGVFTGEHHRVTWDKPIAGLEAVRQLPFNPDYLNIKPSRFGTVESLLDTVEYCLKHEIQMYGGGQFELGIGRKHIQALASLFYPEAPNDVAPRVYNQEKLPEEPPVSPVRPTAGNGIV